VDRFVLVESTVTFTGKPKELVFAAHKDAFAAYADKIIHVVVENCPALSPWKMEFFQRNAIMRGLANVRQEDSVLISDVDEIPPPEGIACVDKAKTASTFWMTLYYYYVNCRQAQVIAGTVCVPSAQFREPQYHRDIRTAIPRYTGRHGWHFSFLGGVERIKEKLAAYAETQTNTSDICNDGHIRRCLDTGDDLFFRKDPWAKKRFVPLDDTYPNCIGDWLKEHPECYKPCPI
jgi:beta-1,4-mannosyl-glycoprotein beta-1,4-N-acetylglucosaminyltransferase